FAFDYPDWLNDDEAGRLAHLAKAALFLLAVERTPTGCWGKTYLYRQRRPPAAGGALTGTPFALIATGSYVHESDKTLSELYPPIAKILAHILNENGDFRKYWNDQSTAPSDKSEE